EGASFAVLLADCDAERAQEIAQRLREQLSAPYPVDRLTVEANSVVGYVLTTAEENAERVDVDSVLQRADMAVRATRGGEAGKAYVPSMGQDFLRRFQMVTQSLQAIKEGHVTFLYNPK